MPIPQFYPSFRLNPNSSTNKEKDDESILENRVIGVLKAIESDYNIKFTDSNGKNIDKWVGYQAKENTRSEELKRDPRVAYLSYVSNRSRPLEMRLEARRPTKNEITNSTPWKTPNQTNNQGSSRPGSPTGSVNSSYGSNVGSHGGRRSRQKTRRGRGKRSSHTARRRHR